MRDGRVKVVPVFFFSYQMKMAAQEKEWEWPIHLCLSDDKIVVCGASDSEFSPSDDPVTTTTFSSVYPCGSHSS